MQFNIYVPADRRLNLLVARKSGIVGVPVKQRPGSLLLYFEGNTRGTKHLQDWESRLKFATIRLAIRYPTPVAQAEVSEDCVRAVGVISYTPELGVESIHIHDAQALSDYIGEPLDRFLREGIKDDCACAC